MDTLLRRIGQMTFWLSWPGLWLALRLSSRTRLLILHGDTLLVVRGLLSDGRWQLPGGGLHSGEDPRAGVLREVHEETGLTVDQPAVQFLGREQFRGNGFRFDCRYFIVRLDDMPSPVLSGMEIAAAQWIERRSVSRQTCGADVMRALELLDDSQ